jgi:hypothetical protein
LRRQIAVSATTRARISRSSIVTRKPGLSASPRSWLSSSRLVQRSSPPRRRQTRSRPRRCSDNSARFRRRGRPGRRHECPLPGRPDDPRALPGMAL